VSPGLRVLVLSLATSTLGGRLLFAMPPERGEVKVVIAASDSSFDAIAKSLTESLGFIAVTPQFERAVAVDPRRVSENHPPVESLFAYLWIDAVPAHEIILYITDAATERVFVRRMSVDHGLDAVGTEALAFVVQSSLEALLAGKIIGMTRDDYQHSLEVAAPQPVPKQAAAATAQPNGVRDVRPSHWQLWAGYELQGWDRITLRHEGMLGIGYERWKLRFGIELFSTWPIQFHSAGSGAAVFSNGARLGVSRPLALPRQLRLVPGLGFAMEVTRVRPELSGPDAQPASPYFALDPTIRAVLGIERSLGRWSLGGILGMDFQPRPVRYVVIREAATEVVQTPWRERPFAAIVLAAWF